MIVAVLSDTHLPRGSRRLPDECVERIRAADAVLHAGDFVRHVVLEELRALNPRLTAVHGNMDDGELRARLPAHVEVELDAVRVGMVHDGGPRAGRSERLLARFRGCAAVVYGHSHAPELTRAGDRWLLNPGSPTERRRAPAHTMIELRVDGRELVPTLVQLSS